MNNKKRSIILFEVLTNIYEKCSGAKEFINNIMVEICQRENVEVDQA